MGLCYRELSALCGLVPAEEQTFQCIGFFLFFFLKKFHFFIFFALKNYREYNTGALRIFNYNYKLNVTKKLNVT